MQWEGTGGCKGWYWEEEYVQHVQNFVAQEVAAEGDEAVSQRKKSIDVDPAGVQLSVLVGIGRELIMLLKYILVLFLLAAVVVVVVRLA